jgi:surfactin synthase thioesterase subunit/glycosyltransferase involved in cell wall biosynthesis
LRILLAQNSLYFPAHGGGDKSNRLLMEALAARGHVCRAVARIAGFGPRQRDAYLAELAGRTVDARTAAGGLVEFERRGVEVSVVTEGNSRAHFAGAAAAFHPDVILTSTDDPAQLLLGAALDDPRARVVYLVRATVAVPFGPDCAFPSEAKAARIRQADRVVCVSEYVAGYTRRHGGMDAVHVPISLLEPEVWPDLGRFDGEFVTLVNPCAVKGIAILLGLADSMPETGFAAVPTWGTTREDRAALAGRRNIAVLDPVDDINRLLERTRVLLVPSLWAEARSRMVLEAMARGVPVMASAVGGLEEAKLGVPYLLPVRPIEKYAAELDDRMVPVAQVPPQNIAPWRETLRRLLSDQMHWSRIARDSRAAALAYAGSISVGPFERILEQVLAEPKRATGSVRSTTSAAALSVEKRQLLALRLRRQAPAAAWFPGIERVEGPRLFCLPHAGGGASGFAAWASGWSGSRTICPVRLPGRESRQIESPFERMPALVTALADALAGYLDRPFGLFGHSMGAVVGFELARELRRRGLAQPRVLIASGARAPQFRRGHVPPPDPTDEELLAELGRLDGTPPGLWENGAAQAVLLPALRADTGLYRRYVYSEEAPLDCAICAYGGAADANVSEAHLAAWREQTTGPFRLRRFEGGHFYLQPPAAEFLAALAEDWEGNGR